MQNDEQYAKDLTKEALYWLNHKLMCDINKDNRQKYHDKFEFRRKRKEMDDYNRYMKDYNFRRRIQALEKLGGQCAKCGYKQNWRGLQIDHIKYVGGSKRISGTKLYNEIIKMSQKELKEKYQCLCANCNQIKKYMKKEYKKVLISDY